MSTISLSDGEGAMNHVLDTAIRIISWKELRTRVPLSRVHVGRLEKSGRFPKRVQITQARIGWIESEVEAYLQARAALRDQPKR